MDICKLAGYFHIRKSSGASIIFLATNQEINSLGGNQYNMYNTRFPTWILLGPCFEEYKNVLKRIDSINSILKWSNEY